MIIGVPKEIKPNEARVGLTPAGVNALAAAGHQVLVEAGAGIGSGFSDNAYTKVGAEILPGPEDVYAGAEMLVKVKEPLPPEYRMLREGQVLFTFLHLAPEPELTRALLDKKILGIAYETIQLADGSLPLLMPMSEVAGRMAVQIGAHLLESHYNGRGILLGGVPGVPPGDVIIIGGGVVGTNAAKIAIGLGAHVTVMDVNHERMRYLDDVFGNRLSTLYSNSYNTGKAAEKADLLIGAVLIPGARAPRLVTDEMVHKMKEGSVIVDVAIDQGGCVETIDRVTTHANPTYQKYGVIHYSVANMPGAVPRTSTLALTNATLKYVQTIASKGCLQAVKDDPALAKGVNVIGGHLTYRAVAEAQDREYTPLEELI